MEAEAARAEAHSLLDKVARSKRYTIPRVVSAEEQAEKSNRLTQTFQKAA
jgi:hypothetical protein